MNRNNNTWKKRISLIILAALISASILFATCYCSTSTKATYPITIPTAMDAKTGLSNIMYIKNDTSLYNATYSIVDLYTCQLDQDNYTEVLIISCEQTSGVYYYNLTAIKLGPNPSMEWSKNLTPTTISTTSFTLHLLNISDFNNDGKNEIAIAYYSYYGSEHHDLSVYDGNGGLLKNLTQFWQDCNYEELVVVDWNNDGVNDILSAYWASNNFNVTFVKNVTSGECESKLYPYSASSCSVGWLVAGNFNSTSSELELALSCYTDNYKILILGDSTVKQCFENSNSSYYLYSTGEHLIFGSYYSVSGHYIITLGAYRDSVLWSFTQNVSIYPKCVVADVDLDLKPEIFYKYYDSTGQTYYPYLYAIVDIENGQKTVGDYYVPVPVSFENDWKLLAQTQQYGQYYSTIETYEIPSSYFFPDMNIIMSPRFMFLSQTELVVLNKNYVSVSGLFPKINYSRVYSMLCFGDYDGDGRLESLGVIGGSVALLELEPMQLLSMNVVYLGVYAFLSAHQGVNNGYLYLSVSLLIVVVGLTIFYYVRRWIRALEFDRRMGIK